MKKNIITISVLVLIGLVLWRNYGVVPKGGIVDLTNPKTNEQKELANKIKETFEGAIVSTSFGTYQYQNKSWIKIKEVWE